MFTKAKNSNQFIRGVKKDIHEMGIIEGLFYNKAYFTSVIQHFNRFLDEEKKRRNVDCGRNRVEDGKVDK